MNSEDKINALEADGITVTLSFEGLGGLKSELQLRRLSLSLHEQEKNTFEISVRKVMVCQMLRINQL